MNMECTGDYHCECVKCIEYDRNMFHIANIAKSGEGFHDHGTWQGPCSKERHDRLLYLMQYQFENGGAKHLVGATVVEGSKLYCACCRVELLLVEVML